MKPGEHPEFFRFPAPEGRSRESTITLDRLGRFHHDGERVEREGMNRAFSKWIRLHPDDGRFILSNGYDWTYFSVEDAPFFVTTFVPGPPATVTLSDGSQEEWNGDGLRIGRDEGVYILVKNGSFEAKFLPSAQTALAPLLEEGDAGELCLRLGSKLFPLQATPASAKSRP